MTPAPLPHDEHKRLTTLRRHNVLDSEPEQAFDDLVLLAAQICDTPMAYISFVDEHRQWLKAAVGLPAFETSRDDAICAHAILDPSGVFVVPDTTLDPRFADNPLVTHTPGIRGYAAAVLTDDDCALGTLCVADREPLSLLPSQLDALRRLARHAITQLKLRESLLLLQEDIDRRERTERELAASEQRYRDLVNNALGLICTHDLQGTLIMVNRGACELLGYDESELIGRNLRQFIPPTHHQDYDAYLAAIQRTRTFSGQLEMISKGGRRVTLAYQNFRFEDPAGPYIVGHGIDVTEQAAAEAANHRFRAVLDASTDYVNIADAGLRPLYLNRAGREMVGQPLEGDLRGRTINDDFTPGAATTTIAEALEVALRCGVWSGEDQLRHRDGTTLDVLHLMLAPRDVHGDLEFVASIARDVTDRKRADEALRRSELRFRQVVENIREVIFEISLDGIFRYLNPAWTEITGYSLDETLNRPVSDFVAVEEKARFRTSFADLVEGRKEVVRDEWRNYTKSGQLRWLEVHARRVVTPAGEVTGTAGTLRDVTEQHRLSEQLIEAREEALDASRLKSEFVANMSHEIRTPISGVSGLTALLLETPLGEEQRQYAQGIAESADALLVIINDILDLSKIEAGKMAIVPVSFELRPMIESAMAPVIVKARTKGLGIDVRYGSDLPRHVTGDPLRIRQVLINLADNAVKFAEGGSVTVTVDNDSLDGHIKFSVQDAGIGIPPEKLEAVFEKFTQADSSTSRKYGGTGLGLSICMQLVTLMEGHMSVMSTPGEGSTFRFHLPLPASAEAAVTDDSAPSPLPLPAGGRHLRVLVAEDNRTNQIVAVRRLEQAGCTVDVVEDGQAAVARVAERRYDVVLMDCQMPIMDGYEATRRIRQQPGHQSLPIVALTAHAMERDRQRCLEAGMSDYLSKPVKPEALARVLNRIAPAPAGEAGRADPLPTAATALFDSREVASIFDGDVDALTQFVGVLTEDLPRYAAALRAQCHEQAWLAAARTAHTLKGAALYASATGLAELATQTGQALRDGNVGSAPALSDGVERQTADVVAALRAWITQLRSSSGGRAA